MFAFVSFVWGDVSRKMILMLIIKSLLPLFSSRSFRVSGFIFKSSIHLIFKNYFYSLNFLFFEFLYSKIVLFLASCLSYTSKIVQYSIV